MKIARWSVIKILLLACCLPFSSNALAQDKVNYCEPSASIKEELNKLPKFNEDDSDYKDHRERGMAMLAALAKKYPTDFHVQRRWAEARWYEKKSDRAAIVAEYRTLMDKQPNDVLATYLYASLMVGRNTKEAIEKLNGLAAKTPEFPWTYLKLGEIYSYPAFNDKVKLRENLK